LPWRRGEGVSGFIGTLDAGGAASSVLACDAHAPPEGEVLDLAESSPSGSLALRVGVILAGPFFLARDLSEDPFLLTMHESLEEEESESSLDWSSAAPPPEKASSFFFFWSFPVLTRAVCLVRARGRESHGAFLSRFPKMGWSPARRFLENASRGRERRAERSFSFWGGDSGWRSRLSNSTTAERLERLTTVV
jgi:hypothetical protein